MAGEHERRASLIVYPAAIAVKAMGVAATADGVPDEGADFRALIESLVLPLLGPEGAERIDARASSGGKYHSVSVRFTATSRGQLEAIYGALHAEERVLFTL